MVNPALFSQTYWLKVTLCADQVQCLIDSLHKSELLEAEHSASNIASFHVSFCNDSELFSPQLAR